MKHRYSLHDPPNEGKSFSTPITISDPVKKLQSNIGVVIGVGPNGEVYAAWLNLVEPFKIMMNKSTDGGKTFGRDRTVARIIPTPGGFLDDDKPYRVVSLPTIGVDQTCGRYSGNLYVAWTDMRYGDGDILFTRSTDDGKTWSEPIRVNDDRIRNGKHQFFPSLTVDPTGDVNVVFYDRRNDPKNILVNVYNARSTNGGRSFEPNIRVTDQSFNPTIDLVGGFYIGDYIGITVTAFRTHPVWTDTRTGNQDIFTAAVKESPALAAKEAGRETFPKQSALYQNFPNGFNPETWIPYYLSQDSYVTISIYNTAGKLARSLPLGYKKGGYYLTKDKAAYWDGRNERGERVASGIYLYRMQAGNFVAVRKMTVLK